MAFYPIRYCALMLFVLATCTAFAQKTNFGFYIGPTISTLRLEQNKASDVFIDPYDYKMGVSAGVFGTISFTDYVGIRSELNFERKGGRSGIALSDGHGNKLPGKYIDEHFDYLQVPVLFQLSAGEDFRVSIHVGYAFSYLLHRTEDFPDQINVRITQESGPTKNYLLFMPEGYKQYDHSLVAGVSASPLLSNGMRLQIGLRVMNGKLNTSKGVSSFDASNLSVALLAGVEF